jgi:hypothetical protein
VAAVQYTFTHRQYTEYSGQNTHNNYKEKKLEDSCKFRDSGNGDVLVDPDFFFV